MRIELDAREHATVMAALRMWQRNGLGSPTLLAKFPEHDIATNAGAIETPLNDAEIDTLCERINRTERATELEIEMARGQHGSAEIEIDDDAATSRSDEDNGTWIAAWVWLADEAEDPPAAEISTNKEDCT